MGRKDVHHVRRTDGRSLIVERWGGGNRRRKTKHPFWRPPPNPNIFLNANRKEQVLSLCEQHIGVSHKFYRSQRAARIAVSLIKTVKQAVLSNDTCVIFSLIHCVQGHSFMNDTKAIYCYFYSLLVYWPSVNTASQPKIMNGKCADYFIQESNPSSVSCFHSPL